jgi:hypothetical protein
LASQQWKHIGDARQLRLTRHDRVAEDFRMFRIEISIEKKADADPTLPMAGKPLPICR